MVIPHSFNQKYVTDETRPQYDKKMAMTYTSTSKSFRWCPKVNCQYGVDAVDAIAQAVECKCGWVYCFKCGQEDHTPCLCSIAKEWIDYEEKREKMLRYYYLKGYDCFENYKRCETDLKAIDESLHALKSNKSQLPQAVLDLLQSGYQTMRNTKRLQKWSYAYKFSINDEKYDVLKEAYKSLQNNLNFYMEILKELLKWNYEKAEYLEYEKYKERFQIAKSNCKNVTHLELYFC
jgi:hypothetical protein